MIIYLENLKIKTYPWGWINQTPHLLCITLFALYYLKNMKEVSTFKYDKRRARRLVFFLRIHLSIIHLGSFQH